MELATIGPIWDGNEVWLIAAGGLFTLAALAVHGALYLAWRTTGPVRERSLAFAREVLSRRRST